MRYKDRLPSWVFGVLGFAIPCGFNVNQVIRYMDSACVLVAVAYLLWWNNIRTPTP